MYAKASSDDTAKQKQCINNAKTCKTNPEKNAHKTQKQVTKGCLGMQKRANKMRKNNTFVHLTNTNTCTNNATKMHQKCTTMQKQMHKQCNTNAIKKQNTCDQNRSGLCLCNFLLCICVLFAFFVRFLEKTQKKLAKNAKPAKKNRT